VLLGDVLELRHGPLRDALAVAAEPLGEIAAALGGAGEVVLVAGNHDHPIIHPWAQRRALDAPPPPLTLQTAVDARPGEPLATLIAALAPAPVRVVYPGVWLREDVYAIHGHYLDLHLTVPTIERIAAAVMARVAGLGAPGPVLAEDYEAALAPLYAWIDAVAQWADADRSRILHGGSVRGWRALTDRRPRRDLRGHALAAGFPALVAVLNRAGLGPLRRQLSGAELRRAGLAAMGEVVARLGIDAGHVIFGHTHRAGPLPRDEWAQWRTPGGVTLVNSGCWVDEPAFTASDPRGSPYRPGFAVWVTDEGAPRVVNLLDAETDLSHLMGDLDPSRRQSRGEAHRVALHVV
jgi:hypothetical protein